MRVAFVGKGGAGKSTVAGTFARLLARTEASPVLVLDSDPMPGLAFSLGAPAVDASIPDDAVEEGDPAHGQPRWRLLHAPVEAVERFAITAPDGVHLLQFGKLRGSAGALARSQAAFRLIADGMAHARDWHLIGDLPGGTRQPFFGWARFASTVVVVVEPTSSSMLSARRLARLATDPSGPDDIVAVANKVECEGDAERIQEMTGLEVLASVPNDAAAAEAERSGVAPLDHAPDGAAAQAIASLVAALGRRST